MLLPWRGLRFSAPQGAEKITRLPDARGESDIVKKGKT